MEDSSMPLSPFSIARFCRRSRLRKFCFMVKPSSGSPNNSTNFCSTTMDKQILITGVSCVGKTTIGKILATNLGYNFYDLDMEIEKYFKTSIEKLQRQFISMYSFREEASKALIYILGKKESKNCIVALSPSGLMGAYLRVIKKANAITIVIRDKPENILKRIEFYDIDSKRIEKKLNPIENEYYLKEIKKGITYFKPSYKKANMQIDIDGLNAVEAANKIEQKIKEYERGPAIRNKT